MMTTKIETHKFDPQVLLSIRLIFSPCGKGGSVEYLGM
jgi:hypothetical protein